MDDSRLSCAALDVPLDYRDPGGRRIGIALAKLSAREPGERVGTLVINRGGPGYSSIEYLNQIVAGQVRAPWDDQVRDRYDVVAVDQRGVGRATPAVTCFDSDQAAAAFGAGVPLVPDNPVEIAQRTAKDAEFAADCRAHSGNLLDHLSTATVARDLDTVRAALGEPRLNYLGQSYGTALGAVYASMFPQRVGSFVLDSIEDPVQTTDASAGSTLSERMGSDVSSQEVAHEFLRLCARSKNCAFAQDDPWKAFPAVLASLRAKPVTSSGPNGAPFSITYGQLIYSLGEYVYQPVSWPVLALALHRIYRAQLAAGPTTAHLGLIPTAAEDEFDTPYTSSIAPPFYAFTCNDTALPHFAPAWWAASAQRATLAPDFAALRAYETSPCAFWQASSTDRYTGPWNIHTATPILLLNNRFDPATPLPGAIDLAAHLPGSRLLINEGWGHMVTDKSTCALRAASNYLVSGQLPPPETHCTPDTIPFAS
ncbi:alpha/beta hydrolase [Nocardia sp. CA2R105]|uniref:alpha/beta hydrolase n=1 Tax=Nocardia coffeae TaxID=2873381 RepID=UPI001CA69B9C|nr:alpha/beta hydrolase [Nocardia coffeae]MBY8862493.1 alpha/beta hydrolase [Nocardia coffeae]